MEDEFIGWGAEGECCAVVFTDTPAPGGSGGSIIITASVGISGVNRPLDVRTIQQALNRVPANSGRPAPPLVVDGICGEKTKNAIQKFQLVHFGWKGADGRCDPGGQTVAKLNQLNSGESFVSSGGGEMAFAGGGSSAAGAQDADPDVVGATRVARIQGLINQARNCIRAAQTNATAALAVVDSNEDTTSPFPSLGRSSLMTMLNRHFDIDLFPKTDRRRVVTKILQTFNLMEQVFARPGGLWGAAVFDFDRQNKPYYAYTYSQGYYHPGEKLWTAKMQVRRDAIYFCKKIDTVSDDMATLGIIHELSHFVGYPERIRDKAYGWTDNPKMQRLLPSQKLINAMSYGNYAFEVRFGHRPIGM